MRRPTNCLAALLAAMAFPLGLPGCGTASDSLCEDVGNCSQGGSNSWIQSCQNAANAMSQAAPSCAHLFDQYFQCTANNYVCNGATAAFPGCDSQLSQLEDCLNAAEANSPCGALAAGTSQCPGKSGTSPPGSPLPTTCTLNEQCQASCYLQNVSNLCAPGLSELNAFTQCTQTCPP